MAAPIISIKNLGKRYRLGAALGHDTLRDHVAHSLASLKKLFCGNGRGSPGESNSQPVEIWALKEVSFDVMPGEVIGIIGRNGAGKSTLLKILSQITEPTTGEVLLRGRTASLLEVGTGFHAELTGRENIFLNGAVLGMSQAEIRSRFDEIVAFADIGPFLDTPVKRYSSGMYMRLAFAVAAHLEPEIMIVDEVLAVGDAAFQARCLAKMNDVARDSGRTILFVSHNLAAVMRLCTRGILLERGQVREIGPIANVMDVYQRSFEGSVKNANPAGAVGSGRAYFAGWELANPSVEGKHICHSRDTCEFNLRLILTTHLDDVNIGFVLWNSQGELVLASNTSESLGRYLQLSKGAHNVNVRVRLPIKAGLYQLDVSVNSVSHGQIERAYLEPRLNVLPHRTTLPEKWQGLVTEELTFDVSPAE